LPLTDHQTPALDATSAWTLVSALRDHLRDQGPLLERTGIRLDGAGHLLVVEPAEAWIVASPNAERGWSWPGQGFTTTGEHVHALAQLFDLYMPLCVGPRAPHLVVAHLAQSLDGRIATHNGISQFISGRDDLVHTHRLRALFDAVVVGASTVEHDDPRLTTRHCPGRDPVRVVIDPSARVRADRQVVSDGCAPTLLIQREGLSPSEPLGGEHVEVITVPAPEGRWLPIEGVLDVLRARGLRRIFIEGGGVTVSRFLEAGLLDRLQVSISPMIIGSGRPSFTLPEALDLGDAVTLDARSFSLGRDILFDCSFTPSRDA